MAETKDTSEGGLAVDHLRAFVERIERLQEDRAGIGADIREVYSEAKAAGFDVKAVREVVKARKMSPEDRQLRKHLYETYAAALDLD